MIKSISLTLVFSLLFTMVAPSLAEANLWQERRKALNETKRKQEANRRALAPTRLLGGQARKAPGSASKPNFTAGLKIPSHLGTIVEGKASSNSEAPLIIHIQDAHDIYEAQKNSAGILKYLQKSGIDSKENPLTVFVEGAWGPVQMEWLRALPDDMVRQDSAENLLRQSQITGEQYLAILEGSDKFILQGVEDEEIYKANLSARQMVEQVRAPLYDNFVEQEKKLKSEQKQIYSSKLYELDVARRQYDADKIDLKDYVSFLARQLKPNQNNFPHLSAFLKISKLESVTNGPGLEQEREKVLHELDRKLDKSSMMLLAQSALNLRKGLIKPQRYYEGLLRLTDVNEISTPKMKAYLSYLQEYDSVNPSSILLEVVSFERKVFEQMSVDNAKARQLVLKTFALREQKKFWTEKFPPEDWQAYKANGSNVPAPPQIKSPDGLTPQQMKNMQEAYYKLAFKRDRIMVENTIRAIRESPLQEGPNVAVLIAGGFHTPGITKILREKQLPYVVIRPNFTLKDNKVSKDSAPLTQKKYKDFISRYIKNLETLKKSLPNSNQTDSVIDILKNRLFIAGVVSDGEFNYVLGSFQGDKTRRNFAIKFSKTAKVQNVAANSYDGFFKGVMGSVRALLNSVIGGANANSTLIMQMIAPFLAGRSVGGKLIWDERLNVLTGPELEIAPGWDPQVLERTLNDQLWRFGHLEAQVKGNILTLHKRESVARIEKITLENLARIQEATTKKKESPSVPNSLDLDVEPFRYQLFRWINEYSYVFIFTVFFVAAILSLYIGEISLEDSNSFKSAILLFAPVLEYYTATYPADLIFNKRIHPRGWDVEPNAQHSQDPMARASNSVK